MWPRVVPAVSQAGTTEEAGKQEPEPESPHPDTQQSAQKLLRFQVSQEDETESEELREKSSSDPRSQPGFPDSFLLPEATRVCSTF